MQVGPSEGAGRAVSAAGGGRPWSSSNNKKKTTENRIRYVFIMRQYDVI